jgi:hypothetical protein
MCQMIAKNVLKNYTYNVNPASLVNSTVQIEMPRRYMFGIIPSNWTLGAHIQQSPPTVKHDMSSKIAQITNQDRAICARYYQLLQRGIYRLGIRHGYRELEAV